MPTISLVPGETTWAQRITPTSPQGVPYVPPSAKKGPSKFLVGCGAAIAVVIVIVVIEAIAAPKPGTISSSDAGASASASTNAHTNSTIGTSLTVQDGLGDQAVIAPTKIHTHPPGAALSLNHQPMVNTRLCR